MAISNLEIKLSITDRAKKAITSRMKSSGLVSPIPGLIWAKWNDENEYGWQIGFYESNEIQDGWFIKIEDMTFYTYQDWKLIEVNGKSIDIVNGRINID